MGRLKRLAGNLILLAIGLSLALVSGEFLVRFVIPTSTVAYRFDPDVGYVLQPSGTFRWVGPDYDVRVTSNAAGFHDVEHARAKPPGTYRIVVIGDSMVEALQVPIADAFTRLLEGRVGAWAGRPVEVVNLGVSGKGPAQYHRLLEKIGLDYRPDLVVVAVTLLNDFLNDVPELERDPSKPYYRLADGGQLAYVPPDVTSAASRRREEKVRVGVWLKSALKRSWFARSFGEKLARWRAQRHGDASAAGPGHHATLPLTSEWNVFLASPPPPWDDAYRVTLRVLEESDRLVRAHDARLLVMLIPPKALVEDKLDAALRADGYAGADGYAWDVGRPARAISSMAAGAGIPLLDLDGPLREDWARSHESCSWEHDGHWSPRGHRLAAEALDGWLRAHAADVGLAAAH
jgi:hypothetical protein